MQAKIINTDLNIDKIKQELDKKTVNLSFDVNYEYEGYNGIRIVTIMKYNQNKIGEPYYIYSIFPEKPEVRTITYPTTKSNIFAQFPSGTFLSKEETLEFLRNNYII